MNHSRHIRSKSSSEDSSFTIQQGLLMAVIFVALAITVQAAQPGWWAATGGPLDSNPASDYAVANQGQLKQFTQKAVLYMDTNLPGGAGATLDGMVAGWSNFYATNGYSSTNPAPADFKIVNQGQLKYIGNLMWTNLVAAGYTDAVPTWLTGTNANDYVAVNLGQLKTVFNFDLGDNDGNGLPDWWEKKYLGQTGNDPNATPNGSSTTLAYDYAHGISPFDFDGAVPTVTIVSGDNQSGPAGTTLSGSFTVQVTDQATGTPYAGVGVNFSVIEGNGTLGGSSSTTVTTDSTGKASVFFTPGSASVANLVFASVTFPNGIAPGVIFSSYTTTSGSEGATDGGGISGIPTKDTDPDFSWSPWATNLHISTSIQNAVFQNFGMSYQDWWDQVMGGNGDIYVPDFLPDNPRDIVLSWDPAPDGLNISQFLIEKKINNGLWETLGTVDSSTTTYPDNDLLANQNIYYRVTPLYAESTSTYPGVPSNIVKWEVPIIQSVSWQANDPLTGELEWQTEYFWMGAAYSDADFGNFSFFSWFIGDWPLPMQTGGLNYYFTFNPAADSSTYKWAIMNYDTEAIVAQGSATSDGGNTAIYSVSNGGDDATYLMVLMPSFNFGVSNGEVDPGIITTSDSTVSGSTYGAILPWDATFTYSGSNMSFSSTSVSGTPSDNYNLTISALDPTHSGSLTLTASFTIGGSLEGSQTVTVYYTPPPSPPSNLNVPADDASGALYRKIALNGRPLPDSKPQTADESDQQPEETFVDAMTLGLRHSTTDAYISVPGSELSLSARRNAQSEVWRERSGLRPHERPDMPFGVAWNSNLCSTIKIEAPSGDLTTATVTDENGANYRFADTGEIDGAGNEIWFPFPTAKHEQQTYLTSLTFNSTSNQFTFKRKYGSTLIYQLETALDETVDQDRLLGSATTMTTRYARLSSVTDRLGQTVNYTYAADTNLIPETISVVGRSDLTLSILQAPVVPGTGGAPDSPSRVTAIWDAKGNETQFGYTHDDTNNIDLLTTVTTPDGQQTHYTYDTTTEPDLTPRQANDPGSPSTHCDVASITDPNGKTYGFTYTFDHDDAANYIAGQSVAHAKWAYKYDSTFYGYYPSTGNPRMVHTVSLPDGTSTTTFTNQSNIKLSPSGTLDSSSARQTQVTDANGNQRTYTWSNPEVLDVSQSLQNLEAGNHPKIILYQTMTLTYAGSSGTLGTEVFDFDPDAGLALKDVTDFSGNVTTYTHTDSYAPSLPSGITWPAILGGGTSGFNGLYDDPNSQARGTATKSFTYNSQRIMQSVVDEDGHKTSYNIDSLGRRTEEDIYPTSTSSTPTQKTTFEYGNATYPGFMTRKVIVGGSGTPDLEIDYTPDTNGRVSQEIVDPSNLHLVTSYTYDLNGNKLTTTDPNSHTTTFAYDSRNRLVAVTYADGSRKNFAYDARGNKIMETDENGASTLYIYDALSRLTSTVRDMNHDNVVSSGDLVTSYVYNAVNSKTSVTDPNGHTTHFYYDPLQRLTKTTDALGHDTLFDYSGANSGGSDFDSSGFKPTQITDPRGYVTTISYDTLYHQTAKSVQYQLSPSHSSTTSTVYDPLGNLTSSTDPLTNATTTSYDALNRPVTTTYADGTSTVNAYSSTGLETSVTQVSGTTTHVTSMAYDTAGRRLSVTAADGGVVASGYDGAGNVTSVTDQRTNVTTTDYDARNRPITVTEPVVSYGTGSSTGHSILHTVYDAAGNVTQKIDANGNATRMEYDPANRLVRTVAPLAPQATGPDAQPITITTYDPVGNVHTVTDPRGETTTNAYDALNRLLTTTDALGITVTNTYDEVGNKLTVKDGLNQTTTFTYDGLNRNLTQVDAASHAVTYNYNALNKTARVDAIGQTTEYSYDVRNRLTGVVYDSRTVDNRTYAYDGFGNLTSVTVSSSPLSAADVAYTYDLVNRVVTETSRSLTHTYTYDLAGNRTQTVYGGTSRTIVSVYDALNRLSTMTEGGSRVTGYAYDLNGNIVKKTLPNGDKEITTFDALNRASSQTATTGASASLYTFAYAYDLDSNVVRVAETYPSGLSNRTVTNSYDAINRLTSEVAAAVPSGGSVTTSYSYDAANNRSQQVVTTGSTASTTNYNYNNLNQLTEYDNGSGTRTVNLTYDYNGNRHTRVVTNGSDNGTDTYSYDYDNRLVGLVKGTSGGAGTYGYVYDYRTRRVIREEGFAWGLISYSGGTAVSENSAMYRGTSIAMLGLAVEYIRGSDYGGGVGGILYTTRSGTFSYTHENKRGDIVAKSDGSGALTYQAQYEAFGKQVATTGSTLDRQKSNSKDTDPTGLVDEGFRYRDLETGMFISRDPAGFIDGPNLYTYVVQNPWTRFDPEGLNYVDDATHGAYVITHQSIGQTATDLGIPQMAAQAASGASNLIHGDTQAMGNNLAATGSAIKQTAVQDYNQAGAGAQRLASGNVSAGDLADATGRGLMTGILTFGGPSAGSAAVKIGAKTLSTTPEKSALEVQRFNINLEGKGNINGTYDPVTQDLHIGGIASDNPGSGPKTGSGQSISLYRAAIDNAQGPVKTISGHAAQDNAQALVDSGGDINQTPRARALNHLGYTEHSYDEGGNKMVSKKPDPPPSNQ